MIECKYCFLFPYILTANYCPPIPYVHHARVYTNETDASTARLECDRGFRFPAGQTWVLLSCINGTWVGMKGYCSGEITKINEIMSRLYISVC